MHFIKVTPPPWANYISTGCGTVPQIPPKANS